MNYYEFYKKCNEINKDKYLNVLLTKQNSAGVNRGFRVVNNTMYTIYTQAGMRFRIFILNAKFSQMELVRSPQIFKLFVNSFSLFVNRIVHINKFFIEDLKFLRNIICTYFVNKYRLI